MRHEVRTLHLCDRKLHCVVLHSSPRAVVSQGNSRQSVPLRGHNWVLRGLDRAPGSILGVPPFWYQSRFDHVTVVGYKHLCVLSEDDQLRTCLPLAVKISL